MELLVGTSGVDLDEIVYKRVHLHGTTRAFRDESGVGIGAIVALPYSTLLRSLACRSFCSPPCSVTLLKVRLMLSLSVAS